jgi:hypothetical protein
MLPKLGLVESLEREGDVIDISTLQAGTRAPELPERTVHLHQIDQAASRAKLNQAQVLHAAFFVTPQDVTIEVQGSLEVFDPKDDVIDSQDPDRGGHGAPSLRRG